MQGAIGPRGTQRYRAELREASWHICELIVYTILLVEKIPNIRRVLSLRGQGGSMKIKSHSLKIT